MKPYLHVNGRRQHANRITERLSMRHTILALALTLSGGTEIAAQDMGLVEQMIAAPHHNQDMQMSVMFPATGQQQTMFAENAVFYGTPVLSDAEPMPGKHPVVLLSHGWGGTRGN